MNTGGSIALNALSIVYMVVLVLCLNGHFSSTSHLHKTYSHLIVFITLLLATDIIYLSFYGDSETYARIASKLVKSLYFIVNSLIALLWGIYVELSIKGAKNNGFSFAEFFSGQKKNHINPRNAFFGNIASTLKTSFFLINTLLTILNLFFFITFDITENGLFEPNPIGMWIFTLINYSSAAISFVRLVLNRKRMSRFDMLPLLLFPLPVIVFEIIQIFARSYSLICTYAVSATLMYQTLQNNTIYLDELTGLSNRRQLNEFLDRCFNEPQGVYVCGIMLDLDNLKTINDTYGHVSGDNALITVANIIKSVQSKGMVATRYGGDEFMLVWTTKKPEKAESIVLKLKETSDKINAVLSETEKISFSLGLYCCLDKEGNTVDFLRQADKQLYKNKAQKKAFLKKKQDNLT